MMFAVPCVLVLSMLSGCSEAAGAGRAYPVLTENYVVDLFKSINPRIEWDKTNFLVDLSGNYANCDYIGTRGFVDVDRAMPTGPYTGQLIGAIVDYTDGTETHTQAVDGYIRPVMQSWTDTYFPQNFREQIERADLFACSCRPGCNGQVSVACLFTPPIRGNIIRTTRPPPTTRRTPRTTRPWTTRPWTTRPWTTRPWPTTTPFIPPTITGEQKAKAFTVQQYQVAERITGQSWDRSHELENLSGYETDCQLVNRQDWDFPTARPMAQQRGYQIEGLLASARNVGSTPNALQEILEKMRESSRRDAALEAFFFPQDGRAVIKPEGVGCSLIPDCMIRNEMYVVVTCVFKV